MRSIRSRHFSVPMSCDSDRGHPEATPAPSPGPTRVFGVRGHRSSASGGCVPPERPRVWGQPETAPLRVPVSCHPLPVSPTPPGLGTGVTGLSPAHPMVGARSLGLGQDSAIAGHQHHPGVGAPAAERGGGHCHHRAIVPNPTESPRPGPVPPKPPGWGYRGDGRWGAPAAAPPPGFGILGVLGVRSPPRPRRDPSPLHAAEQRRHRGRHCPRPARTRPGAGTRPPLFMA